MSKVRLYGDTSGFVDLKAPDVAGDVTITLPNTTGPFATETYVDSAVSGLATETYVDDEIAAIPEIAGIGLNVVSVTKRDTFAMSGNSFVDLTGLSVTITPTSATSKILVLASVMHMANGNNATASFLFARGGTHIGIANAAGSRKRSMTTRLASMVGISNNATAVSTHHFLDSPATTSATTYKVRISSDGSGAIYVNRNETDSDNSGYARGVSSLTVIEVAA